MSSFTRPYFARQRSFTADPDNPSGPLLQIWRHLTSYEGVRSRFELLHLQIWVESVT